MADRGSRMVKRGDPKADNATAPLHHPRSAIRDPPSTSEFIHLPPISLRVFPNQPASRSRTRFLCRSRLMIAPLLAD
jgi:hypothetical protein